MKRFHVHVAVENVQDSIRFYSTMFAAQPTVIKDDYAKWMLEDPRINFAISHRGQSPGVNHLGFQVDSAEELREIRGQLEAADSRLVEEAGASCCYAKSDKYWVTDPTGIAWETFHSLGTIPIFGSNSPSENSACGAPTEASSVSDQGASCCGPRQEAKAEQPRFGCCA